jgi:hypothetical protein
MLLGDDGLVPHGAALALVPPGVRTLLARTEPGARNRFRTGNEVAAAISALERVAYQPTEAYEPGPAQSTGASASDTAVLPVVEPSWEAPTMAAPVAAAVEIVPAPYLPPPTPVQEVQRRSPRWLALLAGASGLLLLLLLGIALLGRERPARAIADAPASPTEQTVKVATVPDLRGRNLEDARQLLGSLGLNLAEGDALNDARIAPDTIVRQQPDPSSQTNTGSVVTVSLSLGPAPTPTAAPQPAPPAQVVPPQPPAVEAPTQPPAKGKKDKKGNGDGDD